MQLKLIFWYRLWVYICTCIWLRSAEVEVGIVDQTYFFVIFWQINLAVIFSRAIPFCFWSGASIILLTHFSLFTSIDLTNVRSSMQVWESIQDFQHVAECMCVTLWSSRNASKRSFNIKVNLIISFLEELLGNTLALTSGQTRWIALVTTEVRNVKKQVSERREWFNCKEEIHIWFGVQPYNNCRAAACLQALHSLN